MYGMNRILQYYWLYVAVDGFIPPNAFMEFQAYNVVIASIFVNWNTLNTRPLQILFMKVLDIPIIANPEYAEYYAVLEK
jgi:phenylalanine-4-hydroxylase